MTEREVFETQANLCRAMGAPARLEIVHALREGPKYVSDLARIIGLSQPTVSRHLAALRRIGILTAERQRIGVVYRIANPKIVAICDLMREVIAEQAAHLAAVVKGGPAQPP